MTALLVGIAFIVGLGLGVLWGRRRPRQADIYLRALAYAHFGVQALPGESEAELRARCRATLQVSRG